MTFAIIGSKCAPGILDGRSAVLPGAGSSSNLGDVIYRALARHRIALSMRPDVHHVAGRLRLRAAGLKNNPAELQAICAELATLPGVRAAAPNPLTGSIIVDYDRCVLPPDAVATALQRCGLNAKEDNAAALPSWTERAAAKAIEWCLEKLALAMIAAVI